MDDIMSGDRDVRGVRGESMRIVGRDRWGDRGVVRFPLNREE